MSPAKGKEVDQAELRFRLSASLESSRADCGDRAWEGGSGGVSLGTTYTAYTSANGSFGTVKQVAFKVAQASRFAPYGLVAFELSGQADGGSNKGTYGEFGVAHSWPLWRTP